MDTRGKSPRGLLESPESTSQNEASGPVPMNNPSNGFLNLLGVDVVMNELLQYLSVKDLLNLSSVSKDALVAVRKSMVFSTRVQFRISEDSICSGVLDNCFHSWKTVEFESYASVGELVDYIPSSSTISRSLGSLQSFSVDLDLPKDEKLSVRSKITDFVQKIVESSKETLKDLFLCLPSGGFIESIGCPNLKELSLFVPKSTDDQLVESFLKNQPPLEILTADGICPSHLFTGLQGRLFKLRKLDIGIRDVSHDDSTPPPITDWSVVVEGLTKLEEISIDLYTDNSRRAVQDMEEILACIPAETVKKFNVDYLEEREICFSPKLGKAISRFTNLTELVLYDATNLDDDSLQNIIKCCPKLIKLTLGGLEKVTDFGFTGVKKTETGDGFHFSLNKRGVALTDLKDLTELTVIHYDVIGLATILEVIRFEFLTSLHFSGIVPSWQTVTPRQFLLQILQQNPSILDRIELKIRNLNGHGFLYHNNTLEDEVKALYPRIQKLKFLYDPEYSDDSVSDSD